MRERTVPIARIRLARAPARLLLPPLILLAAAASAAAAGMVLGSPVGIALVVAAAVLGVLSLALAAIVLSVRLDVEVAMLRLSWLGGQRRYALARGPVTRVLLRGEERPGSGCASAPWAGHSAPPSCVTASGSTWSAWRQRRASSWCRPTRAGSGWRPRRRAS